MKAEFAKRAAIIARTGDPTQVTALTSVDLVRDIIDPDRRPAPNGAQGFVADTDGSAGTTTGAIGLDLDTTTQGQEIFVIWRPAYEELGIGSTRIEATNL